MAQGGDDPKKIRNQVRPMTGAGPGVMGERRAPGRVRRPAPGKSSVPALMSWPAFVRQFFRLAGPYWSSERKKTAIPYSIVLLLLTVLQVAVPVAINRWMRALFDALEAREMQRFTHLSGILLVIIVSNVLITNFHLRVKRRLQIDWRDWMNQRVWNGWMAQGKHYELAFIPGSHDNPDGRIAEDVRNATEYAIDLAHALVYDILLLISFTQILWSLSQAPYLVLGGHAYFLPGYLVWLAIAYAAVGTVVALALGRPLIRAVDRRQTAEADFRFGLAHARENALSIALARGESDERHRFKFLFKSAIGAWDQVTIALAHMFYYSSSWSVLSQVFPTLVVAPRYIAGLITLGGLMQSAQAFQQMVGALSWAIDNLGKVADWRASAERVFGLINAVEDFDTLVCAATGTRIEIATADRPVLAFKDFATSTPQGQQQMAPLNLEIKQGDRVLLTGETGVASAMLKAVAGLWPWGQGRIELPGDAKRLFMPPRPYMPAGTLRDAIDYPTEEATAVHDDMLIGEALRRVGLDQLVTRLDENAKWDQVLSIEDQQRLGFARLLLKKPDWIFMEEAFDTLDAAGEKAMIEVLRQDFDKATIVAIGHDGTLNGFETRQFVLERVEGLSQLHERETTQSLGA
jgi:vitamin B12/bleomycin/antimicrobial peptide transport system ATP-binding/permease protein